MTQKSLSHTDPEAFAGLELKTRPDLRFPDMKGDWLNCPKCMGHGGWIIQPNSYGENQHFMASCNQCNGWGWVLSNSPSATCIHTYKELSQADAKIRGVQHFGMCYHVYECTKCGHLESHDSSD